MQNTTVSLSIHKVTLTLNIPLYIIEKLEILGLNLKPNLCDSVNISINIHDSTNAQICVIDDNVLVTNETVAADILMFRLFVEIEDLLMRKILHQDSSAIALHGGGVVSNGKAILVLQGKGSGKSTLISKLCQTKTNKYLSDDLLISYGSCVLGVPLPIRLRCLKVSGLDLEKDKNISGLDFDNQIRHFYMPSIATETLEVPVSTILVPHYDPNAQNSIVQVKGNEKTSIIMNQVKKYPNMEQMYKNILLLSNNVTVYHLYYQDLSILDLLSILA